MNLRVVTIETQRHDVPTGTFLAIEELTAWLRNDGYDNIADAIEEAATTAETISTREIVLNA